MFPLCYSCVWSAISSGKLTVIEGNNVNYPNDRVRRREISSASSLIYSDMHARNTSLQALQMALTSIYHFRLSAGEILAML
ncbi:MAG: hypothetical protein PUH54_00240 [Oscillospiraceae bacterium]|nr:hypothetical protein [Oscillospiraceae bacterium]